MRKLSTRWSWLKDFNRQWQKYFRSGFLPTAIEYRQLPQEQKDYYRSWSNEQLRKGLVTNGLIHYKGCNEAFLIRRYRRRYRFEMIREAAAFGLTTQETYAT